MPRLSVVIPTRNRHDCLQRAIQGLYQQTTLPDEIVVVDDGSDSPVDLGSEWPLVRVIRNPISRGASASKNQGLKATSGELVAYFDDDSELLDPDTLANMRQFFVQHEKVGAVGFRQLQPDGTAHRRQPCTLDTPAVTNHFFSYGCVIRRSALDAAGGWLELLGYYYEEDALSMRIIEQGYHVVYHPDAKVVHYEDPANRDWHRVARLNARNIMLTTLVQFPAYLVLPALANQFLFFVRKGHGSRMSPRDVVWLVTEMGKGVIPALRARSPVSNETIRTFKRLHRCPFALHALAQ